MGENEMKPRPGLPCGVRLTAGLGGAGGTAALALAAETVAELERRATLDIGVVFTTGSVPELSPVQHRLASKTGVAFAAAGVLEPFPTRHRLGVPNLRLPIDMAVRCSSEFLTGSLAVKSEQLV